MNNQNDFKIKNLRSLSLRNLNLDSSNGHNAILNKQKGRTRRTSFIQSIQSLDNGMNNEIDLIKINRMKLLDSFFTIHLSELVNSKNPDGLIYISDIVRSNTNPNFGIVNLPSLPNNLMNCKSIILKIWCRESEVYIQDQAWKLMSFIELYLPTLKQISSNTDEDLFNDNSIVFNLNGRYYTFQECYKREMKQERELTSHSISYSFDSIRSLNNSHKLIKELSELKLKLGQQIHMKLKSLDTDHQDTEKYRIMIQRLNKLIIKQKSMNDNILSEIVSKKIKINQIKTVIEEDFPIIKKMGQNRLDIVKSQIEPITENLNQLIYPSIISKLQEYGKVTQEIILIDKSPQSIRYTIMGLEFPSTIKELLDICYYNKYDLSNTYEDDIMSMISEDVHQVNIDIINSGLSFIIQLLINLSEITRLHLKYRLILNGSECYIVDLVTSLNNLDPIQKQRNDTYLQHLKRQLKIIYGDSYSDLLIYPLYHDLQQVEKQGMDYYGDSGSKYLIKNPDFEQGLKLLNKNLVYLINHVTDIYNKTGSKDHQNNQISNNIPIDCLDNFLWNLQFLLLFITAPTS